MMALCCLVVVVLDGTIYLTDPNFVLLGFMDKMALAATTMVSLSTMMTFAPRNASYLCQLTALVSSVLIDVDHVPLVFDSTMLTANTDHPRRPRPTPRLDSAPPR